MTTIALLVTGALGMLGWFMAWMSQRDVVSKGVALAEAKAGEEAAKTMALKAQSAADTASKQLEAERLRANGLQQQLDGERKSRHDLVDALAKKGVPVGDAVVDSALDRLYPDGGGQGSDPGSGGNPVSVSGQRAPATGPSGQG